MNTKTMNAFYWGSTGVFAVMMLGSAFAYLTSEAMAQAFVHLGFPAYFRVELAVAKILGAAALLAPVPRWLKEWAYAGFVITLTSAVIAHSAVDGVQTAVPPIVGMLILGVSYVVFRKREKGSTASVGKIPVAVV